MLVDQLAFLTVKIPVVHFWQSIQDCFYLQLDYGAGLLALSPVQHKACGENISENAFAHAGRGPSPRVWGIPGDGIKEKNGVRFIPTRVGNTPRKTSSISIQFGSSPRVWGILRLSLAIRASRTVHPHACGEYDHRGLLFGYGDRFIPTRVGNTAPTMLVMVANAGSSPACGEYWAQ